MSELLLTAKEPAPASMTAATTCLAEVATEAGLHNGSRKDQRPRHLLSCRLLSSVSPLRRAVPSMVGLGIDDPQRFLIFSNG